MSGAWVVVPTYNEADNLVPFVAALEAALPDAMVLVVDDGSPDGTGRLADALALARPRVEVLHRPQKAGLAGAYLAGFARALEAGAEQVLQLDADFSHDPADLARLLEAVRDGADVAIGSRYVDGGSTPNWPRRRRWLSAAGGAYARALLHSEIRDLTGGMKCFGPGALRAVDLAAVTSDGYAFQIEVNHRAERAGLRIVELPICFSERRSGVSKLSAAIAVEALWLVPALALRTRARPTRRPVAAQV